MSRLTIPVTSTEPSSSVDVMLDDKAFSIETRWNDRDGAWYLSLYDADGEAIITGRRVVADWDLLLRVQDARRPTGRLLVVDTTGAGDPGRDDLGDRVQLVYEEPT